MALAAVGIGTTGYAVAQKESALLWMPLLYFSLMELLQAFSYSVVDQCALPANQIATLLGYVHIVFQPFFGVLMALYFVPDHVRRCLMPVAMTLCFAAAVFMLVQLYPFDWAGPCRAGRILCGAQICTVSGNWHIAWLIPLNDIGEFRLPYTEGTVFALINREGMPAYTFMMFVFPLLIGSWRFTVYHVIMGPVLARLTTSDPNEIPAVWCLLSIGFLLLVIKTPLRRYMHVRAWPFWSRLPGA